MDDFGILLTANKNHFQLVGKILIQALPIVIKSLAFIGTIALLLGGIFVHKIEWLHHSRGTSRDSRRIHFRLSYWNHSTGDCKSLKIFGKKQYH
jgi:predicted DNA repair protein MutK